MARLLAVLLAIPLFAAAPSADATADAQTVLAAYRAAWARADASALARLYSDDAELVSAAATADGRVQIEQLYAAAFAGGMAGTVLTTRLDGVRSVAPNVSFSRGSWRIAAPAAAGAAPYCGRFFALLRRDRDWRIVSFSEVQLACDADSP